MGFFDKNKKDSDEPKEKDGALLATVAAGWKALPIHVKLSILGGLAGFIGVILIIVMIASIPLIFLGYSDEAQNSKDIEKEYEHYWVELCEDEDCSEEQIEAAKKLKKSQSAFYTQLDALIKKNHLTLEQKYIVLTTIFYNYQIDDFIEGSAFLVDENDEIDYNSSNKSVYETEKDTLKELVKQFKVNTAFCSYEGTDEETNEKKTMTYDMRSPSGETFTLNFYDSVLLTIGWLDLDMEGFKESKDACLELEKGKVFMSSSTDSATSIEGYYKYLRESDFLDNRPQNKSEYTEYAKNNGLPTSISSWPDEDKITVREAIIRDIQNIVDMQMQDTEGEKTYISFSSDAAYWWPIGSAEVKEVDGKFYAMGDPYPNSVTSEGGGRIDPITGVAATHFGIDIAPKGAAPGTVPVIAAKSGVVIFPGKDMPIGYGKDSGINGSTYGNYIKIRHSDGNYTLYGHLHANTILVRDGDTVERGQVIAYVGTSGRSTGTHLHFEVREGQDSTKNVTDPRKYIKEDDPRPQSSVSQDFLTWFDANFEGSTGTDSTGTKYLVKDIGDGVLTVGPGVTLGAQRKKFAERGINVDDYSAGSYIDIALVDSIKEQILEEAQSSIEVTLANAGLTLEKEKVEALVVFKYNIGNINGFTDAYLQYGDTQALYDNYFGQYVHVKGEVWPGLVKRRQKEWELFHNHVYV